MGTSNTTNNTIKLTAMKLTTMKCLFVIFPFFGMSQTVKLDTIITLPSPIPVVLDQAPKQAKPIDKTQPKPKPVINNSARFGVTPLVKD